MKSILLLPLALLCALPSCAPKGEIVLVPDNVPRLFRNRSVQAVSFAGQYPEATPIRCCPCLVRSPYTGKVVRVKSVKPGYIAKDPTVKCAVRYFRVPQDPSLDVVVEQEIHTAK
ncbi:hypothetical protein KBB96_02930 [Luteolibacter ambystomatis]|uniref:Uncharacterized protein n=1 Tax=Luteolibacter ambystomatis TaxID=2824561 RepID=A0A975PFX1_9BACT|nr:hypothetical protein [Luteolibacter ambystomatis]QUE51852.1 hypothetical protein KBB96_02930 [Luteolibacter ambystomatis]